jgi:putative transposase
LSLLINNWSCQEKISKLVDLNRAPDQTKKQELWLPLACQAEILGVSRSSIYYLPQPISSRELEIKHQLDELYTKCPFYGSRRLAVELSNLRKENVNRKRVQRYMKEMGIAGVAPQVRTSTSNPNHQSFPYLLKNITASFANHIWSTDITYIRMAKGFIYLTVFLDWFSRFILSYNFSTTLEADFVISAGTQALSTYGNPNYTNSDRGSQMTSNAYISIWDQTKTHISMDGKGRCLDNIFVERLWRTVKYEEVYLKSYDTVKQATASISAYIKFYNYQRIHQALGYKTPASVYFSSERNIS